ncbi:MAG: recombinase zinc ribbon domain-containing protein [Anaerolineae bacterium]
MRGLMRCGFCGKAMVYTGTTHNSLECSYYRNRGGRYCQCNLHSVKLIHTLVLDRVAEGLANSEAFMAYRNSQHTQDVLSDRELAVRELHDLAAEAVRWKLAYGAGLIGLDELGTYLKRIDTKLTDARKAISACDTTLRHNNELKQRMQQYTPLADSFYNMTVAEQRKIILALVDRIILQRSSGPKIIWM